MVWNTRAAGLVFSVVISGAAVFPSCAAPLTAYKVKPATASDFQVLNVCAHAATIAVWAAEHNPHDADRRMEAALAAHREMEKSGMMGDDTPDVAMVMLALIGVETLFKSGAKLTPGQMHDWFVAQSAGLCARTIVRAD